MSSNQSSKQSFCKVCYDANQPNYKSHSVKKDGKVVCPYLLAIVCKKCKTKGHTQRYCPNLNKEKPTKKQESAASVTSASATTASATRKFIENDDGWLYVGKIDKALMSPEPVTTQAKSAFTKCEEVKPPSAIKTWASVLKAKPVLSGSVLSGSAILVPVPVPASLVPASLVPAALVPAALVPAALVPKAYAGIDLAATPPPAPERKPNTFKAITPIEDDEEDEDDDEEEEPKSSFMMKSWADEE